MSGGGIRIADMPDLGIVTDQTSMVIEKNGSGRAQATAIKMFVSDVIATRGTTSRTLSDRFADVIHVMDFGAVCDGATDDAPAINAALASAAPGQEVWLCGRGRHYCATNINVPKGVQLRAGWNTPGNTSASNVSGQPTDLTTLNGALVMNSAATVTIASSGGIRGVPIYRSGLVTPAANSNAFAGVGITIAGDDVYVGYCLIMGFTMGIKSTAGSGMWYDRQRIEWVYGDNQGNIIIDGSHDTPYISHCHFWPFCTYHSGATQAAHTRTGTSYDVTSSDLISLNHNFCLGYKIGYHIAADGGAVLIDCQADGLVDGADGFAFDSVSGAGVQATKLIGCTAYANAGTTSSVGYAIAIPTQDYIEFISCSSNNATTGFQIYSGDVKIVAGSVYGAAIAVTIASGTSFVICCGGFRAETISTAVINNSGGSGGVYLAPDCDFARLNLGGGGGGVSTNMQPFVIASSNPLILPNLFDVFEITGTASFGVLDNSWATRKVKLIFTGVLTVFSSSVQDGILIPGGNVTTYTGMVLDLVHNGYQWFASGVGSVPTSSHTSPGWCQLQDGTIMNWALLVTAANGTATWTYSRAFPNAVLSIQTTPSLGSDIDWTSAAGNFTKTSCNIFSENAGTPAALGVFCFAIGY
jgi:hypothetical protein